MLTDDQIRVIVSLVLSIPLSYPIRLIPSSNLRYLYSFVMGTILQFYVYGIDIWMIFLQHFIVYTLILIKGRNCGALVTGYSIATLLIYHAYRMIVDYGGWVLDISTIMMTMVCKYSLIAYAYQDGDKADDKLSQQQKNNRIKQLPNILDYLVYCQFGPTAITGTAFEYRHYKQFMGLENPYKQVKTDWKLVGWTFLESIFYVIFYVIGLIFFPISFMKSQDFGSSQILYICFYSALSVTLVRFKYYFGWKLSMCAIHSSAFSYNQQTKKFDRINTCNPEIVETTIHLREKVDNWNISVQVWLRKCIYERLKLQTKQNRQLVTFLVSAVWHGLYPGYYISFLLWFTQIHLSKLIYKESQKQDSKWVKIYHKFTILKYNIGYVGLWLLCNWLFSHHGLYFQILEIRAAIRIMARLYFIPIIMLLIAIKLFTHKRHRPDSKHHHKSTSKDKHGEHQTLKQSQQKKQ